MAVGVPLLAGKCLGMEITSIQSSSDAISIVLSLIHHMGNLAGNPGSALSLAYLVSAGHIIRQKYCHLGSAPVGVIGLLRAGRDAIFAL